MLISILWGKKATSTDRFRKSSPEGITEGGGWLVTKQVSVGKEEACSKPRRMGRQKEGSACAKQRVKSPVNADTSGVLSMYAPSQSRSGVYLPHLVIWICSPFHDHVPGKGTWPQGAHGVTFRRPHCTHMPENPNADGDRGLDHHSVPAAWGKIAPNPFPPVVPGHPEERRGEHESIDSSSPLSYKTGCTVTLSQELADSRTLSVRSVPFK